MDDDVLAYYVDLQRVMRGALLGDLAEGGERLERLLADHERDRRENASDPRGATEAT